METFRNVIGHRFDSEIRSSLLPLEDAGRIIRLKVPQAELGRRRFKAVDQHGIEYGIALSRNVRITNGAVLELTGSRAVVIDAQESERLHLKARDAEGGIQLGWHAGHLHWRVRMSGAYATVLLDGPRDDYLVRIERFLDSGVIEVVDSAPGTDGADAATPESLTHSHGAHGHVHVHGQELEHAHEAAPAGER